MNPLQSFLLSLTVAFPAVSGLVRWKEVSPRYRPFLSLMLLATATEVLNFVLIERFQTNNNIVVNVYSLIECLLIISQFYYWRYYSRTRRWYPWFAVGCIIVWIIENIVLNDIRFVGPVFRVTAAFILVTLSINEINYIIINESRNLLKNARFLICTAFLIYFLYQILLEGSIYISSKGKNAPVGEIIELFSYMNAFVNVLYGVAVWFIPKRSSLHFKNTADEEIFNLQ